jgi:signal transduction histidine kinase
MLMLPGTVKSGLMNVLINAIQAVDNGGKVELTVKDEMNSFRL